MKMLPPSQEWMLEAWGRGSRQTPLERALTVLESCAPDRPRSELEALSIAERDAELLRLREATFGDTMRALVDCRRCGATLEFDARVGPLLDQLGTASQAGTIEWESRGTSLSLRQANSRDLAVAAAAGDPAAGRWTLLSRCATARSQDGSSAPIAREFEDEAVTRFEALHQATEIVFALPCPACGETERAELDIAQFLWSELCAAASALVREVHELASAYGWAESAILGMSRARRAMYLGVARG